MPPQPTPGKPLPLETYSLSLEGEGEGEIPSIKHCAESLTPHTYTLCALCVETPMKIGLISDTHSAGSGRDLPGIVLRALQGVDLILHCGDLECLGVLDYLETVAPVLAVRGYEDPVEKGDRLAYATRVVHAGAIAIGMIHDIQWPGPRIATTGDGTGLVLPEGQASETLRRKFGRPVDVVLFGDTHEELVCHWDGVLMVNPGSPTYPGSRHPRGSLGTIALLETSGEETTARIINLETGEEAVF